MDFEIGNILYVVITLVAVIVGLLGRKKKKPSTTGSEPGETGSKSQPGFLENLENILKMGQEGPEVVDLQEYEEDLTGEEPGMAADETVQQPVAETPRITPSFKEEYEQVLDRLQNRESDLFLAEADSITETIEVIDIEEGEGTDYFEIIKDFDAGTAVVYSAIINRIEY